jgi:hypothetical protein
MPNPLTLKKIMKTINQLACVCIITLLCSCAATYKKINPPTVKYPQLENDSIFSYRYNVLKDAGNRKQAKKEYKKGLHIVAIKIANNTGMPLVYGQNFRIYSGGSEVRLLDPITTTTIVKQTAATHLLYLLLTPTTITSTNGTRSDGIPVGLVLGPALAIGNLAVAATANKRIRQELEQYDVLSKQIPNGETFYGLIGIRENGFAPLSLKLMK